MMKGVGNIILGFVWPAFIMMYVGKQSWEELLSLTTIEDYSSSSSRFL